MTCEIVYCRFSHPERCCRCLYWLHVICCHRPIASKSRLQLLLPSIQEDSMATISEVNPAQAKTEAAPAPVLSNDEILRYSRHLIMPEVGMEGQQKLKAAKVLCIGAGGLGSPLALYLGAAGVGTLGIVDFDVVDYTNLQRQIIHSTADVGRKKLDSAADKLKGINPFLNLRTF